MDKTIEDINWEDVKSVEFKEKTLLMEDYINIHYKTNSSVLLSINKCIPLKVPPDEDVVVKLPKDVKQLVDLPSADIDKIKTTYKNRKSINTYLIDNQMYILYPHIEEYEENKDRVIRWEQLKKAIKEKWESSKPKLIIDLKKQIENKLKEVNNLQNEILNLM